MSELKELETEPKLKDQLIKKFNNMLDKKELIFPKNYSVENAINSAFLILKETKDKNDKLALEVCSKESIANSLLDMVTQGLNPAKKQCYFIVYGKKLILQKSYMGQLSIAKRIKYFQEYAQAVFKDDKFEFIIENGLKKIIKHEQTLSSLNGEVIGAYVVLVFNKEQSFTEIMSISQIKKAWNMGFSGGNTKAHKDFSDEMAKKTVINRAIKLLINSSDDSYLFNDEELVEKEILENTGNIISFDNEEIKEISDNFEEIIDNENIKINNNKNMQIEMD